MSRNEAANKIFDSIYERAEAKGVSSPRFVNAYQGIKNSPDIFKYAVALGGLFKKKHFFYTRDWVEGVIEVWERVG